MNQQSLKVNRSRCSLWEMVALILIVLAVALFALTGCTTTKTVKQNADGTSTTNTAHAFDLQMATNAINNVVPAAVRVLVLKEPKAAPYLRDASVLINGFILGGNLSPDNLRDVLKSAGMKELRTDEALAVTETVLALYQTYFGQAVRDNVNQNVNVVPILRALAEAIDAGLAVPSAQFGAPMKIETVQLPWLPKEGVYAVDLKVVPTPYTVELIPVK